MTTPVVPDSARDPDTPPDVVIRMRPREPDRDPTLGIAVPAPVSTSRPLNRLVTIGDSITQGFQSAAIFNTKLSWPAIVAWEMGWDDHFRFPTYDGFGGLPFNLEFIIRDLEQKYGDKIDWWEVPLAAFHLNHTGAEIRHWWENGPGSIIPKRDGIMHNLAVFGWDLRDALSRDANNLQAVIASPPPSWFHLTVSHAGERAAMRIYDGARDAAGTPLTVFQAAAELGRQGGIDTTGSPDPHTEGIETLIVALGANNALRTVTNLSVKWSGIGYNQLGQKDGYTVWRPTHFANEFAHVVAAVQEIQARHVIFGNVPHVTIAPIARGVGGSKVRPDSRYFPYYTRPWIEDVQFDPSDDPYITEQQARAIDSAIDQYNDTIADAVRQARSQGLDWYVLDIAGILDRLAARRYIKDPQARPTWWTPYPLPPLLDALSPKPDSRFFSSGPEGRVQGGLFSLDGVHPTTIAYGILAQEFINIMQRAGVKLYFGDGKTERTGAVQVDFKRLLAADMLMASPPRSLTSDLSLIGWLDQAVDFCRHVLSFPS